MKPKLIIKKKIINRRAETSGIKNIKKTTEKAMKSKQD